MQRLTLCALQFIGLLTCTLAACQATLAGAPEAACPPEERAVLSAYAQCVTFYAQHGSTDEAAALEAHAASLGDACNTETSTFIGADPYKDLLGCAQAMAEAGEVAQARKVEPVAQAYRAEQMLRLVMHGGQLLDPARYMGRPRNYERKKSNLGPIEQRITTDELSAGRPKGGGWKLVTDETRMPVVYWKDPAWMSTRPVRGQNVVLVLTTRSPDFARSIAAKDFPGALEALLRRSAGKNSRVVSTSTTHSRDPGDYCADYTMLEEETGNPGLPDAILETSTWGFACLERSSKLVIQAYCSESKPREAPSVLDDVLRGEAEAFLLDITFRPKR